MSFDPMAVAVDWLDAYRAGDIETILAMYANDAVVHCGCGGMKTITGKDALRSYWLAHVRDYPAFSLVNFQLLRNQTILSYNTHGGMVSAILCFNTAGRIHSITCGRSN